MEKQDQKNDTCGRYQTYNNSNYGPTFAVYIYIMTSTSLASGYVNNWSYGMGFSNNILTGSTSFTNYSMGDMEVFTIEPGPEPTTILLLGSGLIGLAGFRRKFRK